MLYALHKVCATVLIYIKNKIINLCYFIVKNKQI